MRTLAIATLCLAASFPFSVGASNFDALKRDFAAVRAPELPARAAVVVAGASASERTVVAATVVRAGLEVNAASAPMLVGAIARHTPSVAAVSASTAASIQPKQVAQITRAAVGAAPVDAGEIVAALCKAQPAAFYTVGISAGDVAPKQYEAILNGVSAASPAHKALIARARAELGAPKSAAIFGSILKRADALLVALSKSTKTTPEVLLAGDVTTELSTKLAAVAVALPQAPPTVGPPYTAPSGSPGEITTSQTYVAPPGGRDYSGP